MGGVGCTTLCGPSARQNPICLKMLWSKNLDHISLNKAKTFGVQQPADQFPAFCFITVLVTFSTPSPDPGSAGFYFSLLFSFTIITCMFYITACCSFNASAHLKHNLNYKTPPRHSACRNVGRTCDSTGFSYIQRLL